MKRMLPILFLFALLTGCGGEKGVEEATSIRSRILQGERCEFTAEITADYSDAVYVFKMHCVCDASGNIHFEVISPDSIAGITGQLQGDGGRLTFDEHALLFSLLADGRLSPVSGPWILMRALRSGYISGCESSEDGLTIHIDDTYDQNALQVIVKTQQQLPILGEVYDHGKRILTIYIEDFSIL